MRYKSTRVVLLSGALLTYGTVSAHAFVHAIAAGVVGMYHVGRWLFGHGGGAALPAVTVSKVLTVKVFTSAMTGATLMTVKTAATSFVISKAGLATILIAAGGSVAAAEFVAPTKETLKGLDYKMPRKEEEALVDKNIESTAKESGIYIVKYCLLPDGSKEIIPSEYIVCPRDSSRPQTGEQISLSQRPG